VRRAGLVLLERSVVAEGAPSLPDLAVVVAVGPVA
jgi:hypothetical protein